MVADPPPSTARPRRSASRRHHAPRWPGRRSSRHGERRWPRRLALGAVVLVALVVVAAVGVVVYARYRFDQIHKQHVHGLTAAVANHPFDILLVGSDSRAFVDNASQAAQFGSKAQQTGQRSDVIIIARIDPSARQVRLLSIPRDTWVDIPGHVRDVSGPNRINAAFNSGPSLLVSTIGTAFHIPVTYYADVDFPGFQGMVNALGGIYLDFPDPVRDAYSGLDVTSTGCQLVAGAQALALVRSRHLYYFANGQWNYDGLSDLSRIRRQDAFFRAVAARLRGATANPIALNDFLGAATRNVTIDQTLSEGELVSLARIFRNFTSAELTTETLPTAPVVIAGQDVLLPAVVPDEQMIARFLAFGEPVTAAATSADVVHLSPGDITAGDPAQAPRRAPGSAGRAALVSAVVPAVPPVTTLPGAPAVTPAGIDYNTQPEPWNPVPCSP